jgi:predicted ester cyclase
MKRLLTVFCAASLFAACNGSGTDKKESDASTMSSTSSTKSSQERNKETALASLQAMNNHDADAIMKDATPDIVDYGDGTGHVTKGVDSIKAGMKTWFNAIPDFKGENLMALSDENHVAVVGDWSGTFKNEMMGMKPTGKPFKVKDVDIFTFNNDGKITEHRNIQTFDVILKQVGAQMKQ